MRPAQRAMAAAIAIGATGCAGLAPIEERAASWHGAPVSALTQVLGEPASRDRGLWVWRIAASDGSADCRYVAFVDDGRIDELATLSAIGPCAFGELPAYRP